MVLVYRKLYRLAGLVFPLIYFFSDKPTLLFWLSLITAFFVVLELLRFLLPGLNQRIFQTFGAILKQEAQQKLSGSTYFLAGSLLTVIFFEQVVAIAALLFLIFGDAFSALVGVKCGRTKIGKKSLEGSLAFFGSCFLLALILKFYLGLDLKVGLAGAGAATLVELLPWPINDNLSIPLAAALVMAVLS